MGRLGTPEEIAALAVYLASDAAQFITGPGGGDRRRADIVGCCGVGPEIASMGRRNDGPLWASFDHRLINAGGVQFHTVEAGAGDPVILLAGFPQNNSPRPCMAAFSTS